MASCNDDFPLIITEDNHPHATFTSPRITIAGANKVTGAGESDADSGNAEYFSHSQPFSAEADSDPNKLTSGAPNRKRNPYYYNKKLKPGDNSNSNSNNNNTSVVGIPNESGGGGEYRVDYRKDREEWSDAAIECLLEAYTEKFKQLNRGNLRGRDWEEVAVMVNDRCDMLLKSSSAVSSSSSSCKSIEQCKNKIDNLKKRYKVELQRMSSAGLSTSNWNWFKKIETIIGNSSSSFNHHQGGGGVSEEDKSAGASPYMSRQSNKRYAPSTTTTTAFINNTKSKSLSNPKWRRVVFKISGAALAGNCQSIDPKVAMQIASEVATACRLGVEVAIVVGGRNFFCGDSWVSATGLDRPTAYQIGMMATVMNSILLQSALEKLGVQTRVQSAFVMPEAAEPYSRQRAIRHLEKGRVVLFGGIGAGTGNPLFTTDTAAALRASEIHADAMLKGTNVNGIYDCHSSSSSSNATLDHISFREVVSRGVTSMDVMAITYCEENGIPVVIFNLLEPGNISKALCGDLVGTLIDQAGRIS